MSRAAVGLSGSTPTLAAAALLVLRVRRLRSSSRSSSPPTAATDLFGKRVAVDGDTAVVGAENDEGSRGAVYVFTRTGGQLTTSTRRATRARSTPSRVRATRVHRDRQADRLR